MVRFILILGFLISGSTFGQNYSYKKKFGTQKNTMYFYWGYNRSIYSKSNITFYGPGYDFTLLKAKAHDKPSREAKTYLNFNTITVPQFNIRIGWLYKFRWDWSIGYDHMKYVMTDNQELYVQGSIDSSANGMLAGFYNKEALIPIPQQALHYENTNGLNFVSVRLTNTAPIWKTNNSNFAILRRLGGGFGPIITQTDFNWDGETYHSPGFKLSGYGLSVNAGIRFDFFQRFFFMSSWDAGFIHLPKNATIRYQDHWSKQMFVFGEWQLVGGVMWYLRTKNGCDTCPDWH